jgi:DNA-binding transcriptional LysR family regulator
VQATDHAHRLAAGAAELIALLDALDREVAALARGEAGQLRIGSFPTASARLLPPALAALTKERPKVDIAVDEGELTELLPGLVSGQLDLTVAYRYPSVPASWPSSLVETPVLTERLWLLLPDSHRYAGEEPVRLAALRHERWVAPVADSPGAVNLERLAAVAGFGPRISFRSNDYSVVRGLVAAGLGVALVPGLALTDTEGVVARPLPGRSARRQILALYRPTNSNSLVVTALSAIRHTAATLT